MVKYKSISMNLLYWEGSSKLSHTNSYETKLRIQGQIWSWVKINIKTLKLIYLQDQIYSWHSVICMQRL